MLYVKHRLPHLLTGEIKERGLQECPFSIRAYPAIARLALESTTQGHRGSFQLPLEVVMESFHQSNLFGVSPPGR